MTISTVSSAAQEAMETPAQTRAEASQGDVQAKLKVAQLAKLQGQGQPAVTAAIKAALDAAAAAATPSVPPPPTGAVLNVKQ